MDPEIEKDEKVLVKDEEMKAILYTKGRDSRYSLKQRTVCKMIGKLFEQTALIEDTFL